LNEKIIYYSYYLKDLTIEDLVVEETVDKNFEFEQTIQVYDTSKLPSILDLSIIILLVI